MTATGHNRIVALKHVEEGIDENYRTIPHLHVLLF